MATLTRLCPTLDPASGGIFRDSFANVVELLDDALQCAARADEPIAQNFVRKHYLERQWEVSAGSFPGIFLFCAFDVVMYYEGVM